MDPKREAKIWEDGLRTDPNKKSFEWWYFDANFKDGSTLVVTFFTKQAQNAKGKLNPSIQVVYTTPKGEKQSFSQTYLPSEFRASSEKCDVWIGPNHVEGDLKTYKLHLELPEIEGDLEFKRVAPSLSTTKNRNDKLATFGWFPSIPYGTVTGKITISNQAIKLIGTGYHDHNWGTMDMKNFIKYWYWGRGKVGDYYTVFSVMYLPFYLGGKEASIFYLAKGDKLLVADSNKLKLVYTDINPPTPTAKHLPTKLEFTDEGEECHVTFQLNHPKLIESIDPFTGSSRWKMFWVHLFGNPRYVRYNADLEMEIMETGKTQKLKGNGLYEIMILH